jgi:hypothetical protein
LIPHERRLCQLLDLRVRSECFEVPLHVGARLAHGAGNLADRARATRRSGREQPDAFVSLAFGARVEREGEMGHLTERGDLDRLAPRRAAHGQSTHLLFRALAVTFPQPIGVDGDALTALAVTTLDDATRQLMAATVAARRPHAHHEGHVGGARLNAHQPRMH